jgi:hypothetical protein
MLGASCDVLDENNESIGRGIWNDQGECEALTPEPETTKSSLKNWKTYQNDRYGFSLKYPSDYEVSEEFIEQSGNPLYIIKFVGQQSQLVLAITSKEDNGAIGRTGVPAGTISDQGSVQISGKSYVRKVLTLDGKTKQVLYNNLGTITSGEILMVASLDGPSGVNYENVELSAKAQENADQILESFKVNEITPQNQTEPNSNNKSTYVDAQFPNLQIPYPDSWEVSRLQEAPNTYHDYWLHIASFQKEGLTLHYEIKTWDISSQKTSTTKCTQNNNLFVPAGNGFYRIRKNDSSRIYKSSNSLKEDTTSVAPDQPLQGDPNNQWVDNPPRNITFEACYFPEIYPQTKSTNDEPNQGTGTEIEIKLLGVTDQNWRYLDEADQIVASTKF